MRVLIDGDIILYKAGFSAQAKDPESPVSHSIQVLNTLINFIKEYLSNQLIEIESTLICLSPPGEDNFRYKVAKTKPYKENRRGKPKPLNFDEMRQYLIDKYEHNITSGQEADDEMGILAQEDIHGNLIVSSDKDMRMVPGWHWEMSADRKPYFVDLHENDIGYLKLIRKEGKSPKIFGTGLAWFYAQCLMGDTADNIPGIKGMGVVGTHKALESCKNRADYANTVINIYKDKGLLDRLPEIQELLWIRIERVEDVKEEK